MFHDNTGLGYKPGEIDKIGRTIATKFTSLQMKNNKILLLSTLSGFDVALLEQSVNTSGTSYKWIQLPLLRANHYMEILDELNLHLGKIDLSYDNKTDGPLKTVTQLLKEKIYLLVYGLDFIREEVDISSKKFIPSKVDKSRPEEAEHLSVNMLLFRIYLLRSLKYEQVELVELIGNYSAISNANIKFVYANKIAEKNNYKDFVSIINKPKAPAMDWAVTFFNSKNIPTFLFQAPDIPNLRSQSNNNSQNLTYKKNLVLNFVSIINKPKAPAMDWAVTFFNSKNIPTFLFQAPDIPNLRSQSNNNSQNLTYKKNLVLSF
ncbi:hypothetical protein Glove_562g35 [Diversispora epigaea]|uniref:Uncharacterized protein n=1 Tax=Diversispora epigaea TaxID=1348612 RepID=A0A397GAJ8_9GLOM|nr:hypothetical protein Glove_562g35 [Diversispora epigaea]